MDIKDSKGEYTDAQLIAKLVRGLNADYDDFLTQYYFLQDIPGITAFILEYMTARLLTHESKLQEKAKRDKVVNMTNKDNQNDNQNDNQKGKRTRSKFPARVQQAGE